MDTLVRLSGLSDGIKRLTEEVVIATNVIQAHCTFYLRLAEADEYAVDRSNDRSACSPTDGSNLNVVIHCGSIGFWLRGWLDYARLL